MYQTEKMKLEKLFTESLRTLKRRLNENNIDNLIWIVNLVPTIAGFSYKNNTVSAPFWILQFSLLTYVYGVGNVVYQVSYAQTASEYMKSNVNVSLLVLVVVCCYWYLKKRPLWKRTIEKMELNDTLASNCPPLQTKHERFISVIKWIVLIFYATNLLNLSFVYLPHRSDVANEFSMTPCVGMEPLDVSPNHEICSFILGLQEITIPIVVLNFQTLLVVLVAHTAGMYKMMADELMLFNSDDFDNAQVKEKLPQLIGRHVLTLEIVDNLKSLYSMPFGVNFGTNAVCMAFFFYLPVDELLAFMPIVVYCFLVFFLYCFLCQRLVDASEVYERAVYSCGWEKFDVAEQKTVYMMLLLAQVKIQLLAADIVPVNMYTFATTLQGMFKFVTVVKF